MCLDVEFAAILMYFYMILFPAIQNFAAIMHTVNGKYRSHEIV